MPRTDERLTADRVQTLDDLPVAELEQHRRPDLLAPLLEHGERLGVLLANDGRPCRP